MSRVLSVTLVADGTSDAALLPIVEWILGEHLATAFSVQLARGLPPHSVGLLQRVSYATARFPCDLLVVHRDAEGRPSEERYAELENALVEDVVVRWVPVVPVRMTEAWLLFDSVAIRRASSNSHGQVALPLPSRNRWERETDPKETLFAALRVASELHGRRLDKFDVFAARYRLAGLINDFSTLRGLDTFDRFEAGLGDAIRSLGLEWLN